MLQTPVAVVSGLVTGQVAWPVVVSRGQVTVTPVGVAEAEAEAAAVVVVVEAEEVVEVVVVVVVVVVVISRVKGLTSLST